jgi:hypothetical protein
MTWFIPENNTYMITYNKLTGSGNLVVLFSHSIREIVCSSPARAGQRQT